jgi:hypothetical protein
VLLGVTLLNASPQPPLSLPPPPSPSMRPLRLACGATAHAHYQMRAAAATAVLLLNTATCQVEHALARHAAAAASAPQGCLQPGQLPCPHPWMSNTQKATAYTCLLAMYRIAAGCQVTATCETVGPPALQSPVQVSAANFPGTPQQTVTAAVGVVACLAAAVLALCKPMQGSSSRGPPVCVPFGKTCQPGSA